ADLLRIDLRARHEVIDCANAVPALDSGGGVAVVVPPPAFEVVGAVVDARDLAELQRVDDEANVAVGGEPQAVVLERGLVAVAPTARVSANVEDRRVRLGGHRVSADWVRQVKV